MASEPFRDRWIRGVLGHQKLVLLLAAVITFVAALLSMRLRVDTDLRSLLPHDHVVVTNLDRFEQSFGSTGSVNVVVKGGSREQRHAFADAIAEELADHPLLRDVDYRLPSRFFAEHALYFLATKEMEELQERVSAWIHYEYCSQAPDVCVEKPDARAPNALREFIDSKRVESLHRTGFDDYYERDGIEALVVLLHPTRPSSDLDFTRVVAQDMRAAVERVHEREGPWTGSGLHFNLVGPYIVKAEGHATIQRDMLRSGMFGLVGVVTILFVLFRSLRAVVTLLVPLLCGVAWSLAAAQLVLGHLNSMTSLISTVVMGLGIDAGIHFLGRIRRHRRHHGDVDAIRLAFHGLIFPLLIASATTIGAFLVMASSRFPAFREFGIIAAMGVALCLLAMVTVLPALGATVGIKPDRKQAVEEEPIGAVTRLILARPGWVFAAMVAVTLLSFQGARKVEFEYNGRTLQSDRARATTEEDTHLISQIFGKDIHAGVLVVPTLEEARDALGRARARHELLLRTGESVVSDLFGVSDLLPPGDVDLRQRADEIRALREDIPETAWRRIDARADNRPLEAADDDWAQDPAADGESQPEGDAPSEGEANPEGGMPAADSTPVGPEPEVGSEVLPVEDARLLRNMLAAAPFGIGDLPEVVLNRVRSQDGHYGVFAYPNFDAADMRLGVDFMDETRGYVPDPDRQLFVGETTVYAAMYLMMRQEAPIVLAMATVLIAALVFWQLRSLSQMVLTLVPLGLSLWWLIALMGATGLKFTLFNLPILPAVLGIGVDNGVYLVDRIRRSHGDPQGLAQSLQETGGSILAATTTTAVGFAAFMVADSGGLRGIGALAMLGILLAAAAAIFVLPTVTAIARRRQNR